MLGSLPGRHISGISSWVELEKGGVYAMHWNKILDVVIADIVCELDKFAITWFDPVLGVD